MLATKNITAFILQFDPSTYEIVPKFYDDSRFFVDSTVGGLNLRDEFVPWDYFKSFGEAL